MPRYHCAGLTIESSVALPELTPASSGTSSWVFDVVTRMPVVAPGTVVHEAATVHGDVWLVTYRGDGWYVLRFFDAGDFVVVPAERRIACVPAESAGDGLVRHLLLNQVMPRVVALDDVVVLHASAVAVHGCAVAFIGSSGAGKSTLAAGLVRQGFELISDDFLVLDERVDRFEATPSYPGLRLWPDSADHFSHPGTPLELVAEDYDKRRLVTDPHSVAPSSVPLAALVILGVEPPSHEPAVRIRPVTRREAFMQVFEQAFRMEPTGAGRQAAEFERFSRLVEATALSRLEYRRTYAVLDDVADELRRALEGLVASPDADEAAVD